MNRSQTYRSRNGARLPSVTEVLALASFVDFGGIPLSTLHAAAKRGRQVHTLIHDHHAHMTEYDELPAGISDSHVGWMSAYLRFLQELRGRWYVLEQEIPLIDHFRGLCGTPDQLGLLDWHPTILDLKTSAEPPAWMGIQLAGYAELVLALRSTDVRLEKLLDGRQHVARFSLCLRGDGTYRLQRYADHKLDRQLFLAAFAVARWRLEHFGFDLDGGREDDE